MLSVSLRPHVSAGLYRAARIAVVLAAPVSLWSCGGIAHSARDSRAPVASGTRCDLIASPSGSDGHGDGSAAKPFASLRKLDAALTPGQTGCLRGGVYGSTSTETDLTTSGTDAAPITITAYPAESPTLRGFLQVEAAHTTVSHLNIDGANTFAKHLRPGTACSFPVSGSLTISGAGDVLEYDNYYQSDPSLRSNGIGIGFTGHPDNAVVRFNRIHDVGKCLALDHLIYLSHGNNVKIYGNWMWNDAHGWGVQLYPAPRNARIWGNVIDQAGAGFTIGNEPGEDVSGNQIWNNVVMNSIGLPSAHLPPVAISDSWGGVPGHDNIFAGNDSYNNAGGIALTSSVTVLRNSTADPQLADPRNHDYTPTTRSSAAVRQAPRLYK